MQINAFKGKDKENNKLILEALAFNNPSIKWDVHKTVNKKKKISWATISRRIDDLKERGYIMETGKRKITVAKREEDTPEYGLTWKGLIASLDSEEVRNNIVEVIEKNPQLEQLHKAWLMVRGIFAEDEVRHMTQKFFEAIKLMPLDLETGNEIEFILYLLPALGKVDFRIPDSYLSKLRQNSEFLRFLYKLFSELEENLEKIRKVKREIEKALGLEG